VEKEEIIEKNGGSYYKKGRTLDLIAAV